MISQLIIYYWIGSAAYIVIDDFILGMIYKNYATVWAVIDRSMADYYRRDRVPVWICKLLNMLIAFVVSPFIAPMDLYKKAHYAVAFIKAIFTFGYRSIRIIFSKLKIKRWRKREALFLEAVKDERFLMLTKDSKDRISKSIHRLLMENIQGKVAKRLIWFEIDIHHAIEHIHSHLSQNPAYWAHVVNNYGPHESLAIIEGSFISNDIPWPELYEVGSLCAHMENTNHLMYFMTLLLHIMNDHEEYKNAKPYIDIYGCWEFVKLGDLPEN